MSKRIISRKGFINTAFCSCSDLSTSYLFSPWKLFSFLQYLHSSVYCVHKRGILKLLLWEDILPA